MNKRLKWHLTTTVPGFILVAGLIYFIVLIGIEKEIPAVWQLIIWGALYLFIGLENFMSLKELEEVKEYKGWERVKASILWPKTYWQIARLAREENSSVPSEG